MALVANDLRDEIDRQLANKIGSPYDAISAEVKAGIADAVAAAVKVWLVGGTGLAKVHPGATITVTVTSVSGVTTGAGVSGPGTGTAVIS